MDAKLFQDNESCILLAKKGRSALGKRTRAMNIRYFAIKDHIDSGQMQIAHLGTDEMVADYFTKPLQGAKFFRFRSIILGDSSVGTHAEVVGGQNNSKYDLRAARAAGHDMEWL